MIPGTGSRTALVTARYRAEHQRIDGADIFPDPYAISMIGEAALERVDPAEYERTTSVRRFIAVRARLAEELLAAAVARGVRRYLVLGAGLDTFAQRNPYPDLEVVEIDHPDTQAEKRARRVRAGLAEPPHLRYLAVDFARESLADVLIGSDLGHAGLGHAGLVDGAPSFASWLGVTYYIDAAATAETLRVLAAANASVVFDYYVPAEQLDPVWRARFAAVATRVAAVGEPFVGFFTPEAIAECARAAGYRATTEYRPAELIARYRGTPEPPSATHFGRLLHAEV